MSCKDCKYSTDHPAEGWIGCVAWSEYRHMNKFPDIWIDAPDGEIYNAVMLMHTDLRKINNSIINQDKDTNNSEKTENEIFIEILEKLGPSDPREGWLNFGGMTTINYCIVVKEDDSCYAHKNKNHEYERFLFLPEELSG